MQTKQVMTHDVKWIHRNTSLKEAANTMKEFDIGMLPVVDDGKVVGILTDRDIVLRAVAAGKDPDKTEATDAMSTDVITAYDDQETSKISDLMKTKKVRRLVVFNRNDKIAGVYSLGDIANSLESKGKVGEILENITKPGKTK